eukprot:1169674-Rhodomonas_salina.1
MPYAATHIVYGATHIAYGATHLYRMLLLTCPMVLPGTVRARHEPGSSLPILLRDPYGVCRTETAYVLRVVQY